MLGGLVMVAAALGSPCGGGVEGTCVSVLSEALDQNAEEGPSLGPEVNHRPESGQLRSVYDANASRIAKMQKRLRGNQASDLRAFLDHYNRNKARYQAVADAVHLPPELIAALHWRESTGDFGTYMHQGDPLGRRPRHHPTNIPTFYKWEDSAIHAFGHKAWLRDDLRLTENSTDLATLATYAEYYNGLGYYQRRIPSPYVFSGTDQYNRGKYVSDGKYSRRTRDGQLGVVTMIQAIRDSGGGSNS
jgi:lysozyme family protein